MTDPNDPIRNQSVPSPLERDNPSGYELDDPLEEDKDSPVNGLTHRYPDRVLMLTTPNCSMYCRYCTRKRATLTRGGWEGISKDDERMIEYIRQHTEIKDVVVTEPGSGYSSPPKVTVKGFDDVQFQVTLRFVKDLKKNGGIESVRLVDAP